MIRLLSLTAVLVAACFGQKSTHPLVQYNAAVDELIQKVTPSVVQILVNGYGPQADSDRRNTGFVIGRQRSVGSGFVIDSEGHILTNAHVINGADQIRVILPETGSNDAIATALSTKTKVVQARVVGVAADIDVALLKVEGVTLPALPMATYRDLRQGEMVFAFGSPQGLRNTVTHGVISAVARQSDPDSARISIQTDAPINPGNSGGPLVNIKGEVVGMNTFILSQSGGNEGLGFAVPCATIRVAYRQLKQFGRLRRQEIGIEIQSISPALATGLGLGRDHGVIISDTMPNGPAERVGLKAGDILLSVDKQPAENVPTVSYNFLLRDSGEKVHLEVLRGDKTMEFDVQVIEEKHDIDGVLALATPDKNLVPELGMLGVEIDRRIAPMLGGLRSKFGVITAARTNGAGRDVPLVTGDVITSVNNQVIITLDGLRKAIKDIRPGDPVVLQIERDGKMLYLTIFLDN